MSWQDILYSTEKFEPYGMSYFMALALLILTGFFLIIKGRTTTESGKLKILKVMSFVLSSMIIVWGVIEVCLGRFYFDTDLPLIFCNFIALFLPFYIFYRKQIFFDILYYVILVGAVQAIITPGLKFSFPHYEFIKFWTVHMGLIIFILYEMIVFEKRPTADGIIKTFLYVQVYMIIVIFINWVLEANYLFLNIKPEHGSLLDLLGGWPWYIVWMDLILIPYFTLLYFPVWLISKIKKHP